MSATKAPPGPQPLIPEKYFDVPTQRLYALSFVALVQVRPILFHHYAHYDHRLTRPTHLQTFLCLHSPLLPITVEYNL